MAPDSFELVIFVNKTFIRPNEKKTNDRTEGFLKTGRFFALKRKQTINLNMRSFTKTI